MVLVEEVVFSGFIHDPHQVIFRSLLVWEHTIDFADDQRDLITSVIQAKSERLG
jgi:hypothetical protein